jgi:hypothetical protein
MRTIAFADDTEANIHDFETSLKHQAAADRRSVVLGFLALLAGLTALCFVCAGLIWITF